MTYRSPSVPAIWQPVILTGGRIVTVKKKAEPDPVGETFLLLTKTRNQQLALRCQGNSLKRRERVNGTDARKAAPFGYWLAGEKPLDCQEDSLLSALSCESFFFAGLGWLVIGRWAITFFCDRPSITVCLVYSIVDFEVKSLFCLFLIFWLRCPLDSFQRFFNRKN
jgi:hypothetical protein